MELPNIQIVNLSRHPLGAVEIEPMGEPAPEASGIDPATYSLPVRARDGSRGRVSVRGAPASGRSRVTLRFGAADQSCAFELDGAALDAGLLPLSGAGEAPLRVIHTRVDGRSVFTLVDAVAPADWMAALDGSRKLTSLSLPGTHDTCARVYGGDLAICQTMTLREQLDAGVRFIDIRCRHIEDVFTIHHGVVYLHLNFGGGVRDVCQQFLAEHPGETIVMSIKQEYEPANNTRTFEQTLLWYLEGNWHKWFLEARVPTLSEVRGKIVLFRRFGLTESVPSELGLPAQPWQDNTTFDIDSGVRMRVQDQYVVPTICDIADKWKRAKALLDEARAPGSPADTLFVDFTSGTSTGCYPYTTGKGSPGYEGVNSYLRTYLTGASVARSGGILMDFPEWPDKALIPLIIAQN